MKLHNMIHAALLGVVALGMFSCSNIPEDERLIPVKIAKVNRAVLIEDFTGQRCLNCPDATDEIETLKEQYGDTAIIAVGIHSGPLSFEGSKTQVGLKTATGQEYYDYWKVDHQPMGVINRNGGALDYQAWNAKVYQELQKPATLSIKLDNAYDESTRQLTIDTRLQSVNGAGEITGKLQLWLIEDDIVAIQKMPDNSTNKDYHHQHVFRAAVNGTWGEDVRATEEDALDKTASYTIPAGWNPDNVSVVAFVYDDSGVLQVVKKAIKAK